MYRYYNDYELIYMIQSLNCEIALNIMFKKYHSLIYKYIYLYGIKQTDFDDCYQESIILMYETIKVFDDKKGKTFTRFYELVLKRKIIRFKKQEPKYDLVEKVFSYTYDKSYEEEILMSELTLLEKNVYEGYFVLNQRVNLIAKNNNLDSKQIYNAIFRIKEKYKSMI